MRCAGAVGDVVAPLVGQLAAAPDLLVKDGLEEDQSVFGRHAIGSFCLSVWVVSGSSLLDVLPRACGHGKDWSARPLFGAYAAELVAVGVV